MNDFQNNRSGRGFGRRDFKRRSFGDRSRPRMMHKAVCADCGNPCEVPFRPSGDRPVYCSNCFEKRGPETGERRPDNRNYGKPKFDSRRTPPFSTYEGGSSGQILEQLRNLSAKMDKIIAVLVPNTVESPLPKALVAETKITEPNMKDSQMVEKIMSKLEDLEAKTTKPKVGRKKVPEEKAPKGKAAE